ncbi:hypothetical protein L0665_07395 [Methanogenium marinum]|uniref:Uncharacterized protein n=1 Tax=Methanogenium marinum TaxID=348610 RepID=A0A9Q4KVR2_9EURY|nr:hypothetical protein [Methanogenium marinum]MDE4908436.1 hypothetical protein [Methanogenium marinum]
MSESELIHRDTAREVFIEQSRARLDEVREIEAHVRERIGDAPQAVQENISACNLDIDRLISQAEVEIDCIENAEEHEWIAMRIRVDSAIGEAMGGLERCSLILDSPAEHVQWE